MTELLSERAARAAMVEVGRRLYARGLVNGGEGNLSCRLGPRRLLCTPTGVNKGFLTEDMLVVTDFGGEPQSRRSPACSSSPRSSALSRPFRRWSEESWPSSVE